jgi:diacylglycerol diphosphate phosphatase / phosphatidate phosphatase
MAFSNQPGPVGAIARFWARTYAADYVALGVVATGFILVSHPLRKEEHWF